MARESQMPPVSEPNPVTTIVFRVRSVPAALYTLGGFATNGINLTLESYLIGGSFSAAQFYVDAEGHPEERLMQLALKELEFFAPKVPSASSNLPGSPFRENEASITEADCRRG